MADEKIQWDEPKETKETISWDSAPKQNSASSIQDKSMYQRGKDIIGTGIESGIFGAALPEITEYGGRGLKQIGTAIQMYPAGRSMRIAGEFLEPLGQAMKTQRGSLARGGFLSGVAEESAGQAVEGKVSKTAEEVIRFGAGAVGPEFIKTVGKFGSHFVPNILKSSGSQAIRDLSAMLEKETGQILTPSQKQYVEKIVADIRGGKISDEPANYLYLQLKQGSDDIANQYATQAKQLEKKADDLIANAKISATNKTAEAAQRTAKLQSEFENSSKNLTEMANQRAKFVLETANAKANAIRERAKFSATNIRDILEIDAKQALKEGQQQAQQIIRESQETVLKLRQQAGRQVTKTGQEFSGAKQKLTNIGSPATETQTGEAIRDAVLPRFNLLKTTRDKKANVNFADAFNFALIKEQQGQTPRNTQAFANFSKQVSDALTDPVTRLANVPEGAVKQQLTAIAKALEDKTTKEIGGDVVEIANQQLSFQGLETLRRVLRDRASGLPAEGADAISQDTARKLAEGIESIQKEFSPGITKALEQYKADSAPLNEFRAKLGQAIVGKEDFDMGRFVTDPASVAKKAFTTETAIKDLITFTGGRTQGVENIARNFVANKLKDADAKQVQSYLKANNDWLNERTFPKLFNDLTTAAQSMGRAESFGSARNTLEKALRTEARGLPSTAQTAAQKAEEEALRLSQGYKTTGSKAAEGIIGTAEKEAAQITSDALKQAESIVAKPFETIDPSAKAVQRQAGKIMSEAEKTGQAGISEAEKRAGTLRTEAKGLTPQGEQIRQLIMGDASPATRMKEIILSGSPKLWEQVGPIIAKDPKAKELFSDAVRQVIATKAQRNPSTVVETFRTDVRPFLESSGLMNTNQINKLAQQLDKVNQSVGGDAARKISTMERLIIQGITGEVGRTTTNMFNPLNSLLGI